jgi:glutaredoxin
MELEGTMKEIIVLTTPTCPYCNAAKEYLMQKGYKFTVKDISVDTEARDLLRNSGIMGVPAFNIGGEMVVGFDKEKIEELIDYSVIECESCASKMRLPKGAGRVRVTCKSCGHQFETTN